VCGDGVVTVDSDPGRLDLDTVHRWLSTDTYWATGLGRATLETAVANSLNFGAYHGDALVGYARVVTDRATFAWLCDVYVDRAHRGAGVGQALVTAVVECLEPMGLRRALLATADAHGVYARFGFEPLATPGSWMERRQPAG
jgi:GNAT superfamily N-acetyltransferase